ncbi:Sugar-binding cellulase-like [Paenibacillus sp. 453mf]|nr:Sugar-binding cellulase-like [Paenibacillus sp. 453mf]
MQPYIEEAVGYLRERHPDILITASYTLNEAYSKSYVARNLQVAHFHLYIKGVLNELMDLAGLNDDKLFPNPFVQSLLRDDAPPFEDWTLPKGQEWRMEGNPVGMKLIYLHDWVRHNGIPVVIGEGYVGYTPLNASFEEGPGGKYIAEYAIRKGMALGFWGMTLCSNCAPHHPFWADIPWQQRWNRFNLDYK